MTQEQSRLEKGPMCWENWHRYWGDHPWTEGHEFVLLSDCEFGAYDAKEFGLYELIVPDYGVGYAGLVLRVFDHRPDCDRATFDRLKETHTERYHAGGLEDEIAALVALCFGMRLQTSGVLRRFHPMYAREDSPGYPILWEPTCKAPQPKFGDSCLVPALSTVRDFDEAKHRHPFAVLGPLDSLPNLAREDANALVKSARLYQQAAWISESEPHLAWLLFVSAVEVVAVHWRDEVVASVEQFERSMDSDLIDRLRQEGGDALVEDVASYFSDRLGATARFVRFLTTYLPQPPMDRPEREDLRHKWTQDVLEQSFREVYNLRSRALHDGTPFPAPLCSPPLATGTYSGLPEVPTSGMGTQGGTWQAKELPMYLHVFEHTVRGALLNWWRESATEPNGCSREAE